MKRASDEQIIEMCAERDGSAFDLLTERYGISLYRFLYSLSWDHATAEDILQETLLKVYMDIDRFERDGNFESWMRRIARNLFIDRARLEKHRGEREVKYAKNLELFHGGTNSVEKFVLETESAEEVRRAVAELPEKQRTAIALFTWGEAGIKEISEIMECSEGTVMTHLHRARQALREILKNKTEKRGPNHELP